MKTETAESVIHAALAFALEEEDSHEGAGEAVWCNARDDKPSEFFQGTPAADLDMDQIGAVIDAWAAEGRAAIAARVAERIASTRAELASPRPAHLSEGFFEKWHADASASLTRILETHNEDGTVKA